MTKKKVIVIIVVVAVLLGAAAVLLGPHFSQDKAEPMPMPLAYATLDELKGKVDGLEAVRAGGELSWQDSYRLGVAYLHLGNPTEAVTILNEAREVYPRFYKTEEVIGMAHFRLGELQGAIESWERALNLNPGAEHLADMIERAKRKRGMSARVDMLEAELKRTDIRDKKNPPWAKRLELATLYLVDKRVEDALTVLNKALEEKDDSSDIYDMLARGYAMSGDFAAAVNAEKNAIKYYKAPADVDVDGGDGDELKGMKQRLAEMKRIAEAKKEGGFHKSSAPLD